jgi:hypothetical protein
MKSLDFRLRLIKAVEKVPVVIGVQVYMARAGVSSSESFSMIRRPNKSKTGLSNVLEHGDFLK